MEFLVWSDKVVSLSSFYLKKFFKHLFLYFLLNVVCMLKIKISFPVQMNHLKQITSCSLNPFEEYNINFAINVWQFYLLPQ